MELKIKKFKQEGDISWQYNPLRNLVAESGEIKDFIVDNKTSGLNLNVENPIDIECQPSYDGTVNLIFNDGKNPPRIINTRWSQEEKNTFRIVNRDQINQSNLYNIDYIDRETRLFRNVNGVTKIDLYNISYFGKLKGGNYTIYLKYMDEDYNETDIVAETGIISVFNGSLSDPSTITGSIQDEETDKSIILKLRDLDTSFAYFKLYVYRSSCDSNGVILTTAYKINKNYEIKGFEDIVYINGFEETTDISIEELNLHYNIVDSVETQAQVQNMLFFGNVSKPIERDPDLQDMSLYIKARPQLGDSVGYVDPNTYTVGSNVDIYNNEYYSPLNIYYKLGYWPDEIYRFGIVYIYNDDHLSPVYNLRGCKFSSLESINIMEDDQWNDYTKRKDKENKIPSSDWFAGLKNYQNTKGVFQFPKCYDEIFKDKDIKPLGIQFTLPYEMVEDLKEKFIKGFFFVRQLRIPTILAQGYSIGVEKNSYVPMIEYHTEGDDPTYWVESFKDEDNVLVTNIRDRLLTTKVKQSSGLICLDADVDMKLGSMFDTSEFVVEKIYKCNINKSGNYRRYYSDISEYTPSQHVSNLVYIQPGVPQKIFKDYGFSTKAGMQEDLKYNAYFESTDRINKDAKLVRGTFASFIGTTSNFSDNCIYNIRIKNYNSSFNREYFEVRMADNSPFYPVSERFNIKPQKHQTDYSLFNNNLRKNFYEIPTVFRGDCFSNTVTVRMHTNFISNSVPINDTIIDEQTWADNFKGVRNTTDWDKINKADVDAVPIGHWLTYKCLSNYNLNLRCIDTFNIDEVSIMGNERGFYPNRGLSVKSSNKIPESRLLNSGYNRTLGMKRNFTQDKIPFAKDVFDTRVMFSNIQVDGSFKNSYKVFQGLAYEDFDKQYGGIVKIIPWGVNLFCVFEHALAIIPVNEKALFNTTEGASIHLYGSGVLQKQLAIISDRVGSTWKDSIIKTPVAIYGVDTSTHKIWRYSSELKLEILSDFKMQRFLHDNIDLKENEKNIILGYRNVKTHYNSFKGDVMFTYYNDDKIWNICYNEVLGKWVTRYSWTPLLSENIDYSLFSFDLNKAKIFGIINTNLNRSNKDQMMTISYNGDGSPICKKDVELLITSKIQEPYNMFNIKNVCINAYYWDEKNCCVTHKEIYNNSFDDDYEGKSGIGYKKNEEYNSSIIEFYINNVTDENKEKSGMSSFNINMKDNYNNRPEYLYYIIDYDYVPGVNIETEIDSNRVFSGTIKHNKIVILRDKNDLDSKYKDYYDNALLSSIFVHGRALNADEINYQDKDPNNQCLPTKWYNRQEPFEFEVVISEPKGAHKIFDNLMLISNNAEPDSIEIEITGDAYGFNKDAILNGEDKSFKFDDSGKWSTSEYSKTIIKHDPVDNQYYLSTNQKCYNIKKFGRRLGNIVYNEDKWYYTIRPIYYKTGNNELRSTKIRDKYAKIRVKYKGDQLAIIVALQTLITLSYT